MRERIGNCHTGCSTDETEQHALGENLADDSGSGRSQRHAHGQFRVPCDAACQQQIGDVCACDEQYNAGENHEHPQALAGLLLQSLDASSAGNKNDVLARDLSCATVSRVGDMRGHPLPQLHRQLGLQGRNVCLRCDPAEEIQPRSVFVTLRPQGGACTFDDGLVGERHPEVGRALNDAIAKEPRGRDTDHREGMGLHINRGAYDAWIASEIRLPGWIAEHQNRCSTGLVVAWYKRPARINAYAQRSEVIPGNKFRAQRLCRRRSAAHSQGGPSGLQCRKLLQLWRGMLKLKVEVVREEVEIAVIAFETVEVAASTLITNPIEVRRVTHRKRALENTVNQRENGGIGAYAER